MKLRRTFFAAAAVAAANLLTACGGGDGGITTTSAAAAFSANVNSAFSALATTAGLTSSAIADLFDASYLDAGLKKSDVLALLSADSQALATSPDLPLFPMAMVSNVTMTNCDSAGICMLNGTLTNADADTTAVDFSTKVKFINGMVYFYGDQSASAAI
jgi:hypothetical protein